MKGPQCPQLGERQAFSAVVVGSSRTSGDLFLMLKRWPRVFVDSISSKRAIPGFEPRTLSENHTTRPNSRLAAYAGRRLIRRQDGDGLGRISRGSYNLTCLTLRSVYGWSYSGQMILRGGIESSTSRAASGRLTITP